MVPVMPNKITFAVAATAKYPNLTALQLEYFIKLIVGEVDTDKGFDTFVEQWKKSGGQEITDQVNQKQKDRKEKK
jgi:putative aldouronate transport system substrate-binding protein